MRLKPASADVRVPMPEGGGHLPAEGMEVPASTYWLRRLADGDVAEVGAAPAAAETVAPSGGKKGNAA